MRRKTHEEYIEEVKNKNPNIEVIGKYINTKTKILHRCKVCRNEWDVLPNNILYGYSCPSCGKKKISDKAKKLPYEYINEVDRLNPGVMILEEYIDARTKISHKCLSCGNIWKALPCNVLRGHGCPICGNKKIGQKLKRTQEEYTAALFSINPSVEVIGTYKDSQTPILHKCNICEYKWNAYPKHLLNGHSCPSCAAKRNAKKRSMPHISYVAMTTQINPDVKVLDKYVNYNTKILHECLICGNKWNISPGHILEGKGCPICAAKKCGDTKRKTLEQYQTDINIRDLNITVLGEYVNAHTKILHKCHACGMEFEATPNNILSGRCCPNCSEKSYGEFFISNHLIKNNILYFRQYKYDDLKGVGNGLLSYDFYIPKYNLLCEFNGVQHYKPVEYFGGEEKFKTQQEHDYRKREYAKLHNINLLEIRYDENIEEVLTNCFNNLNSESLETVTLTVAI